MSHRAWDPRHGKASRRPRHGHPRYSCCSWYGPWCCSWWWGHGCNTWDEGRWRRRCAYYHGPTYTYMRAEVRGQEGDQLHKRDRETPQKRSTSTWLINQLCGTVHAFVSQRGKTFKEALAQLQARMSVSPPDLRVIACLSDSNTHSLTACCRQKTQNV